MKKTIIFLLLTIFVSCMYAQTQVTMDIKQYTQDTKAPFRLYETKNIYTFLKLDTRNGKIWQVQWSLDNNEFETALSLINKVPAGEPDTISGRFTLYATTNIYTFLLVDQIKGYVYHVQWNKDIDKRTAYIIF